MTASDAKPPSRVLADALADIRGRQGLSAEALAQRLREHGGLLDRAAISKIENGMRGVSLDEALLLAVALGLSPLHLFLPREDDDIVELAPDVRVESIAARRWIRGIEPLPGQDDRVYRTEVPASEWRVLDERVVRARGIAEDARRRLRVAREMAKTISAELAELDRKATLIQMPPAPEQRHAARLEKQLAVAYEQIADATVEYQDAQARVREREQEAPSGGGD
jgi:transcriptional regulator with XRE-family HTH domain